MYPSDLHLNLKRFGKMFLACGAKFNKETIRLFQISGFHRKKGVLAVRSTLGGVEPPAVQFQRLPFRYER
jgi:hypothetical protein